MGYRPPEQTYRLKFADEDMAGFEIRLKSASSEKVIELSETTPDISNTAQIRELYEYFATRVISWNLEGGEGPLPVSAQSLYAQEPSWVFKVIAAWLKASGSALGSAEAEFIDAEMESTLPVEALQ